MMLLADESVDRAIVLRLRQEGHAVVYVAELSPSITDEDVLAESLRLNAMLLTEDKDFGELVFRQRLAHIGVVLIRLAGLPKETKADIVAKAFQEHADELLGNFSVIMPATLRIRKPLDPEAPA